MIDTFQLDVSRLGNIDVQAVKQDVALPRPQRETNNERFIVDTALSALSLASDVAELLQELRALGKSAAHIPAHLRGGGGLFTMASSPHFTAGVGPSTAVFAMAGMSRSAGVYGSNLPQLGFYGGTGIGLWTDFGVSSALGFTYVFGPPSVFGGTCWAVGCDMDIPGASVGVGGALLLAPSPRPPYQIIGVSFSVGVGITALPASINVQAQVTHTHAVI